MYECQARMRQDAGILQTISIYILLSSAVIKNDREREETEKKSERITKAGIRST